MNKKIDPKKAVGMSCYHFHPRWTDNYGDSIEDRLAEFEDVMRAGYFNSIIVENAYLNNDEFWRIIFENDAVVWLNIYDSFISKKHTWEDWIAPFDKELSILRENPERWDRFMGFHFDEPVWRGQSNDDFLTETRLLTEMYHKRIFPVFATSEFTQQEGNALMINIEMTDDRRLCGKALSYVTDVAFDSYSVDVREDGFGNGTHVDKMHGFVPGIVDGKTYYSELLKILLDMVGHDVNVWMFPTAYTCNTWAGPRIDEGFCIGHLDYMAELMLEQKHPGGLCLYTYYQFKNPNELGLQSHLVVPDRTGAQRIRPDEPKWPEYSRKLREWCTRFKNTETDLVWEVK